MHVSARSIPRAASPSRPCSRCRQGSTSPSTSCSEVKSRPDTASAAAVTHLTAVPTSARNPLPLLDDREAGPRAYLLRLPRRGSAEPHVSHKGDELVAVASGLVQLLLQTGECVAMLRWAAGRDPDDRDLSGPRRRARRTQRGVPHPLGRARGTDARSLGCATDLAHPGLEARSGWQRRMTDDD